MEKNKKELKKEIINKIKSVKSVWVFDGYTEYYLKTNKEQLLYVFRESIKNNVSDPVGFMVEFNEKLMINENNELFYN